MKIKRISVYGLFGVFDHTISLNTNQRITIIHGPNGFGKTAVLRLLNSFFNSRYSELRSISFNKFKVELNDDTVIEVAREIKDFHESGRVDITFYLYKPNIERKSFSLGQVKYSPDIGFPIGILDEVVPGLERIDTRKWMYLPTDEVLSLEEVVERFGDSLPDSLSANLRGSYSKEEPVWLKDIKNAIHIRLIESQRLLNLVPSRSSRTYR